MACTASDTKRQQSKSPYTKGREALAFKNASSLAAQFANLCILFCRYFGIEVDLHHASRRRRRAPIDGHVLDRIHEHEKQIAWEITLLIFLRIPSPASRVQIHQPRLAVDRDLRLLTVDIDCRQIHPPGPGRH